MAPKKLRTPVVFRTDKGLRRYPTQRIARIKRYGHSHTREVLKMRTKLTWNISPKKDQTTQIWVATCEETGKVFQSASQAQLNAAIVGYESYAEDICQVFLNMSKVQSKLGVINA